MKQKEFRAEKGLFSKKKKKKRVSSRGWGGGGGGGGGGVILAGKRGKGGGKKKDNTLITGTQHVQIHVTSPQAGRREKKGKGKAF